jgi:N-acetylmuramoyl-L-alanine amidase
MKRLLFLATLSALVWTGKSQTAVATDSLAHLSPLGETPDWSRLDPYQHTITKADFLHQWESNYRDKEGSAPTPLVTVLEDRVRIVKQFKRPDDVYELRFSESPTPSGPSRTWRGAQDLPPYPSPERPLEGLRIAIDPGHIGGEWAKMEHRWLFIPKDPAADASQSSPDSGPVAEGDSVLLVAKLLQAKLARLGATAMLVRSQALPVTAKRPRDFVEKARASGNFPPGATMENNPALASAAERLFYLSDEIRARSRKLNDKLKPDLALCLHLNAEPWGDPLKPQFVAANHVHLLINGCYSDAEIAFDDQRFELFLRLLQGFHPEEVAMATTVATVMAEATGLPSYAYTGPNARRTPISEYVWSRNLLATRLYACPVLFFEPYVMNNEVVYSRMQAGHYQGVRGILGTPRPSIYEEYAAAVANGVSAHFRNHRRQFPKDSAPAQP